MFKKCLADSSSASIRKCSARSWPAMLQAPKNSDADDSSKRNSQQRPLCKIPQCLSRIPSLFCPIPSPKGAIGNTTPFGQSPPQPNVPGNTSHQRQSTQGFPYRSLNFRLAGNFFMLARKTHWKLFLWQGNSCFKGFFSFPFWKPTEISLFIVRRMFLQLPNNSATSWFKTHPSALRKCWMEMVPCTMPWVTKMNEAKYDMLRLLQSLAFLRYQCFPNTEAIYPSPARQCHVLIEKLM